MEVEESETPIRILSRKLGVKYEETCEVAYIMQIWEDELGDLFSTQQRSLSIALPKAS